MLAKKELVLLEALLDGEGEFQTSLSLAKKIGMTDRTTRKYLQNIVTLVKEHGAEIISKQGYGYCLKISDPVLFERFWQESLASRKELSDIRQLEASEDRQRYILQKLFFDQERLDIDHLLADLFISKTTLSTDLNRIRQVLESYDLSLCQENRILTIDGDEQAIRHFLMAYFVEKDFEESLLATVGPSFINGLDFSRLTLLVLDECRQAKLRLSDFVIHNLVLHLALMAQRLKQGYPLSLFEIDDGIKESREYEVALRIVQGVEQMLAMPIPPEEANYIALHLKVKHSKDSLGSDLAEIDGLEEELKPVIQELGKICHCDLAKDRTFVEGLLAHFSPFLIRLKNQIQLSNPLLDEIRNKYPTYLEVTKQVFQTLPSLSHRSVSDDEWAYIALHLIAAIERQTSQRQLRVLLVCATGYGSAMMLKSRLESEFGSSLTIVDVLSYYEIREEELSEIDVIISSLNLPNHLFLTPVINVSVFLTAEEVEEIRSYLGGQVGLTHGQDFDRENTDNSPAHVSLFRPNQLIVVTETLSRDEILERMIASLTSLPDSVSLEDFKQEVDLREGYSSLVYGDCLAFPHPVKPLAYKEEVVVAICTKPVYWDKKHPRVNFIFLLSPSSHRSQGLKALSPRLVDFVADKSLQDALLQDPSYDQLVTIFKTL